MSQPRPWSWQLQHVVFPGDGPRRRAAVNVTPPSDPPAPPPESEAAGLIDPFVAWLFRKAGLDAHHYRPETLRRRLPACLRSLRAPTTAGARQLLDQSPALLSVALSALLVGVTEFFRDPDVFATLRAALPDLAGHRPGVQVWCAGCSDGAELYSVALLLHEAGLLGGSYVLGTDCRPDAIRQARTGRYDAAAVRNVPPELLRRHFDFRDGAWEVTPGLRRAARWRSGDVLTTFEPGAWDVILFRNTAMYMRPEATYPLWDRLEEALRPGGLLVLGKAERPAGVKRLAPAGACLYRRTRG